MIYFNSLYSNLEWPKIYLLLRICTIDTYTRCFQYKILNNILYLNKRLCCFGLVNSPLCSFCKVIDETILHLFSECNKVLFLWEKLTEKLSRNLQLPILSPQSATLGFLNLEQNTFIVINHILLIFKLFVYKEREKGKLCFDTFIRKIDSDKETMKKKIDSGNATKTNYFNRKWIGTEGIL